jgi:hypothetical protein
MAVKLLDYRYVIVAEEKGQSWDGAIFLMNTWVNHLEIIIGMFLIPVTFGKENQLY